MEAKYKSYLASINGEIVEGILEGITEGVDQGLGSGAKDGLKGCFVGGVIDIRQDDIRDVLEGIREGFVRNAVKEYAKVAFEKSIERYVGKVCGELVGSIERNDIKLTEEQAGQVLDILNKSEREAMKQIVRKLPDNPLVREITDGIQMALEENLEQSFQGYIKKGGKSDDVSEGAAQGMAGLDEPKKNVKDLVKYLIQETVGDVVYKIGVMSTKRIIKELKDDRKDEFIYKLEGSNKEALEPELQKQLDERTKQMSKEVLQNSVDRVEFIRGLERSFEQDFKEYLSHKPAKRSRIKPIMIAIICSAVVIAGGIISRPYWSGDSKPATGTAPDSSSQPRTITVPENIRNAVVTLERTPCFGTCPVYSLTVYGTGRVIYEGVDHVNVTGTMEGSISDEQVMSLISRFMEIDYFSLNDSYDKFMVSDMPSAITSITIDELTKTIRHYHGDRTAPEVLTELEDLIDEIVNSAQWIE